MLGILILSVIGVSALVLISYGNRRTGKERSTGSNGDIDQYHGPDGRSSYDPGGCDASGDCD